MSRTSPPRTAVLLGAQRFEPTLGAAVSMLGIEGKIAIISAGWQEREAEDDELSAHLGGHTVNLQLHARGTALFNADPELSVAHRERQSLLRHLQEIYRLRLDYAHQAEEDVAAYDMPASLRDEVESASTEAIRGLDQWHLDQCARVRADFDERFHLAKRPEVAKHRKEISKLLDDCSAVAIAGGHVAVLINRLVLFGLDKLIGKRPVFAWSAGAMAISDRIVLFHDHPPQGRIARQVLDVGLGFVPNTVVLAAPERRLDLDAKDRVGLLARRFAPSTCLTFPDRAYAIFRGGQFERADGVIELDKDGTNHPFNPHKTPAPAAKATTTKVPTVRS